MTGEMKKSLAGRAEAFIERERADMTEVYYAEDDEIIAKSVMEYLKQQNCRITIFQTIAETKKALRDHIPAMILIDWNMPDGQGDELCHWIRTRWEDLPIIFLTVRGDSCDVVSGFQNGADDYVTKPFELAVLYSRMLAVLRRTKNRKESKLFCDEILLDKERMSVYYQQKELVISQSEYRLLRMLMENKGKTITREQLLEEIWDSNGSYVNDNTLTVTMKRLRQKLQNPPCLKTIRSFAMKYLRSSDVEWKRFVDGLEKLF